MRPSTLALALALALASPMACDSTTSDPDVVTSNDVVEDTTDDTADTADPDVTGDGQVALGTPTEGDPFPAHSVKDCANAEVELKSWAAGFEIAYISYAAQWCTACREEVPAINAMLAKYGDRVGITQLLLEANPGDPPSQALCSDWAGQLSTNYTVTYDGDRAARDAMFGGAVGDTLPVQLLIWNGEIVLRSLGGSVETVDSTIDALIN